MNKVILVAMTAMVFAQIIKVPLWRIREGEWNFGMAFSTGGMPSSHTAFVLTTAIQIGLMKGFLSPLFGLAFIFMTITIHDAVKVRGESGKQAEQINKLTKEMQRFYELLDVNATPEEKTQNLKELIGHTFVEVLGGIVVGIVVLIIYNI